VLNTTSHNILGRLDFSSKHRVVLACLGAWTLVVNREHCWAQGCALGALGGALS
jgi:hypothetical protein